MDINVHKDLILRRPVLQICVFRQHRNAEVNTRSHNSEEDI